jgi:hypothetical protein
MHDLPLVVLLSGNDPYSSGSSTGIGSDAFGFSNYANTNNI